MRKGEVLDLTILQKKGILKKFSEPSEKSQEYVNFPAPNIQPQSSSLSQEQSPFAFLDSPSTPSQTSSQSTDFSEVTVKVENLEYKLERLLERLNQIEDKIENFKNKLI